MNSKLSAVINRKVMFMLFFLIAVSVNGLEQIGCFAELKPVYTPAYGFTLTAIF